MRVFVAGASGVIGRALVPRLLAAGHEVTGMTRSEKAAEALRGAGADAAVADAFDAPGLERAVVSASPEVVVHQLTAIPPRVNPRKMEKDFETNDRLRVEGTRNLVAAAEAAGARRMVAQSIAFAYAPQGPPVVDEETPLFLDAPEPFKRTVHAVAELERQVLQADPEGLVLRYGFFYGPGSAYAPDGSQADEMRARRLPIVGKGTACWSFIHIEDAAAATVAAVERGAPGAYNVTDDEPALTRDWMPVYAEAIGAKPPRRVPALPVKLVGGGVAAHYTMTLRGASNAKAKRDLGWEPRHASWRDGFRTALA